MNHSDHGFNLLKGASKIDYTVCNESNGEALGNHCDLSMSTWKKAMWCTFLTRSNETQKGGYVLGNKLQS